MKLRHLASILPLLLGATFVRAQDMGGSSSSTPAAAPADAPAAAAVPAAKPEKTALEKNMDKIAKTGRKLRAQVKDSTKNDSSLVLVGQIRDAATASLDETPELAADQPDADRAKFVASYQAKMKDFIADVDKLAAALKANDNATAATLYAQLGMDEKADHKEFRKPEDK